MLILEALTSLTREAWMKGEKYPIKQTEETRQTRPASRISVFNEWANN